MKRTSLKSVVCVAVAILLSVSASLFITGCPGQEEQKTSSQAPVEISKETVRTKLGGEELIVVDVRMAKAWEDCDSKITGARREDPGKVSTWAKNYPKDKTIVFYCSCDNEGTSKHVAEQLRASGFNDAYALKGGWKAWIESDFSTEKKS